MSLPIRRRGAFRSLLIALTVFATVVLGTARPANAELVDFGVFASGYTVDELDDETYGAGLKLRVAFFEVRATYFGALNSRLETEDLDVTLLPVDVGVSFEILESLPVSPFFGAGVTRYFVDSDFDVFDDGTGYYGVVGVDIDLSEHTALSLEGLYRMADVDVGGLLEDIEVEFDGLTINAGLTWHF